jgi:hypothetical protein
MESGMRVNRGPTRYWPGLAVIALAITAVCVCTVQARTPQPGHPTWPTFSLTRVDGTTVSSETLARPGRWIVVLLRRPCHACDQLLTMVEKTAAAHATGVVVVVSHAPAADIDRLQRRVPGLSAAAWFLDPSGDAARALHVAEAPVVMGVKDLAIEWTWKGLALEPAGFEAGLSGWLQE